MFDKEFLAVAEDHGLTQHPFDYLPTALDLCQINNPENIAIKNYIERVGGIEGKILREKNTVPLERGLLNATNLIANGLDSEEPTIQLIQLMSAIEALVEQKTFVQSQVCERTALLLGATEEARVNIYKTLSVLYGKRSDLSHGGTAMVTHYDVVTLWELARELCFYFVYSKFQNSFLEIITLGCKIFLI
ncbi:HEPN domain-containing protein [Lactiplantibacillus plantarum]|nr:HEPN domain-containing protein [Lactiplantibacillus plantarum]WNW17979.1 HEPN domain-containing protein [Lactiplantibacillus plantarum]